MIQEKKIKSTVVLSLLLLASQGNSQTVSISTAEITTPDAHRTVQVESAISLSTGTTTNAAKLQNETPGIYGKVSPAISFEYSPSDSVVINTQINAELKRYSEEKTKSLADEMTTEARGVFIWFANESWEFGGDLGASYAENKLPSQLSSTETVAQSQKYMEPDTRLYGAWITDNLSVETGVSAKTRHYWTTTEDRGNIFKNDYDQVGGDFKVGYSLNKDSKLSFRSIVDDKIYKEKPADFSDGAASNSASPNPLLHESSMEFNLIAEYALGKTKFVTTSGLRYNKDRIFGAKDSQTLKLQQKMIFPVSKNLTWSPVLSYSQEKFDKFRSEPETNPFNSSLRVDSEIKLSSPLKYTLSKQMNLNVDYSFSKKDSNYANNSYSETNISTGLEISL